MRRSRLSALGAAAAAGLALAGAVTAAPPLHGVLDPSRSLGGLQLGATPADVRRAWGAGFGRCRRCPEPTWYFVYRPFQPQGAGVAFRRGRVTAIFTLWSPPGWRTTKGLEVGDPLVRVTLLYGALPRVECGGYSALMLPRGGAVSAIYLVAEKVWGFGLSRAAVPVCR